MIYISRLKGVERTATKILTATAISVLIFFNSCEEDPTFLGRDLLPPTDDINTEYTEDILIETRVTEGEPQLTSLRPRLLLGSYNDPNFGFSKADFMTKLAVSDSTVPEQINIDSLVLRFNVEGFYGDTFSVQTLRVYEMIDTLAGDEVHYSDKRPDGMYNPIELASKEIDPSDTIVTVKIDDPDFLQKFNEVDDSVYADFSDFYDFFMGLYITTDNVSDTGAVFYFDLASSETFMNLYYQENDTTTRSIDMIIAPSTPRVNSFYHDYENSRVSEYLGPDSSLDTAVFISDMGGLNTRISFPEIEEWLDKKPLAINRAELYLPVEDSIYNGLTENDYPPNLHLLAFNGEDQTLIFDYRIDESNNKDYYGGQFNSVEDAFVFNIGVHLQSYIEGDVDHLDLVLNASLPYQFLSSNDPGNISANRVILKGPGAANRKMKLKITYTEL